MRLGGDGKQPLAARARVDGPSILPILQPGTLTDQSRVKRATCRREDYAELRRPALDQADVDRVIVAAAHELLGPVERIDQEILIAVRGDPARGDLFLGDHRNAWRGACQGREDDQFRSAVGFGNW